MTATIILVTAWLKRRGVHVVHTETQTESEYEIRDVLVSGAGEKFHVSRLRHAVRVYRKAACECCVKVFRAGNDR